MRKETLLFRMIAAEGRVDSARIRAGCLRDEDRRSIRAALDAISTRSIFIDDRAPIDLSCVLRSASLLKKESSLDLIVVDEFQRIGEGEGREPRAETDRSAREKLRSIAFDLDVPILVLSELSRAVCRRAEKRPLLSDLRDSGMLEGAADVILLLYRDEVYQRETPNRGIAEVIVAKQRNGPIGLARLLFEHTSMRFDDLESE